MALLRVKKILIPTRDKFLGHTPDLICGLQEEVSVLNSRLQQIQKQIESYEQTTQQHSTQLDKQLNEQRELIINSGIIRTGDSEILVKIFNGLKIYLDTRDIAVAPHLALDKIWEPHVTTAWLSLVGENNTIFDVGANFGYFGLLAAYKTNKKTSKVVLIEANPRLIPYIKKTISLNWYNEQSRIECFAASDKQGESTLNLLKDYVGSSGLKTVKELDKYMHNKMHLELDSAIKVPSMTIDDYCHKHNIKHIDLMKMDIEGHEDKAYNGMRKMIKASPNLTLFIEFTRQAYSDPRSFYEQMLKDFGNVYVIDNQGRIVRPEKTNYDFVIGDADDWVMPVFSKNEDLY